VLKYLDFMIRDHETRLAAKVFVVRGTTAEEVMENGNTGEFFISERIESIIKDAGQLSQSKEVTVLEIVNMFDCLYSDPYIPCISIIKNVERGEEEKDIIDILIDGYAIIDNEEKKLKGYVRGNMGRGLNWLTNNVHSGVIVVGDSYGKEVSLEIIDAKVKIIPENKNGVYTATVYVDMTSNIGELQGEEDVFFDSKIDYLEKQQEKVIKEEIERVLAYCQQNKLDATMIGSRMYHKFPVEWQNSNMQDKWKDYFPSVKIQVSVRSKINRTYNIKDPVGGLKSKNR
ncbi:MAG: Ger(x)C family spore germination C-terminal domain-containing protein, partial [Eubacteriales bacterium]